MRVTTGDCVGTMRGMPENSVDSVVTDPPYYIAFMGNKWDKAPIPRDAQHAHKIWAREALRVLKPGGYLLAFGGTRTYHRLACAIEDAGFEIRDCIEWLYGSGFPKSKNVGNGWGTALKPAHEPIVMARKPLSEKSVARNVLEHGTGAINVDGCRVGGKPRTTHADGNYTGAQNGKVAYSPYGEGYQNEAPQGRWPANLILSHYEDCNGECVDGCPVAELDRQSGVGGTGKVQQGYKNRTKMNLSPADGWNANSMDPLKGIAPVDYGDKGGASRFFYVAKASRKERNDGLEGMPHRKSESLTREASLKNAACDDCGRRVFDHESSKCQCEDRSGMHSANPQVNNHPTVKPIALMRYLVRMVTSPEGIVLDPFCGSGSTGCAAVLEGMDFIGIEREEEYVEIAKRRISHYQQEVEERLFA